MKIFLIRYHLLVVLSMFFYAQTKAQDLIVKTSGDSISCKINKVATLYLSYSIKEKNKILNRTIPLKEVKAYFLNVVGGDSSIINSQPEKLFSKGLFLSAGYGSGILNGPQPQNIPAFLDDYLNELRSGTAFHANLAYFPNRLIGVGFHYSLFQTKNDGGLIAVSNSQGTTIGKLSDDIRIQYFAPSIQVKLGQVSNVFNLNSSFGLGFARYHNNAVFIDPHIIKAESLGSHAYLWLEVNLGKHFALTAGGGLFFTKFKAFEIDYYTLGRKFTFTPTEPDNNNRYDLFLGARYNF